MYQPIESYLAGFLISSVSAKRERARRITSLRSSNNFAHSLSSTAVCLWVRVRCSLRESMARW